jgi:hypothetical protein
MHLYCEDKESCRRKIFFEKFTEQKSNFQACGNMCDNCKVQTTKSPRRSFVVEKNNKTTSKAGKSAGNERRYGSTTKSITKFDDNNYQDVRPNNSQQSGSTSTIPVPKPSFVTASQLKAHLNVTSSKPTHSLLPRNDKIGFQTASKFSSLKRSTLVSTTSNTVAKSVGINPSVSSGGVVSRQASSLSSAALSKKSDQFKPSRNNDIIDLDEDYSFGINLPESASSNNASYPVSNIRKTSQVVDLLDSSQDNSFEVNDEWLEPLAKRSRF